MSTFDCYNLICSPSLFFNDERVLVARTPSRGPTFQDMHSRQHLASVHFDLNNCFSLADSRIACCAQQWLGWILVHRKIVFSGFATEGQIDREVQKASWNYWGAFLVSDSLPSRRIGLSRLESRPCRSSVHVSGERFQDADPVVAPVLGSFLPVVSFLALLMGACE